MESDDEMIIPSTSGTSSEIRRMINAEKLVHKAQTSMEMILVSTHPWKQQSETTDLLI